MSQRAVKVCSEKIDSEESLRNLLIEMAKIDWETVSVFPSPFPPEKPKPGEQPDEREGISFIFVFGKNKN